MSQSTHLRKQELECLRLEADCLQLADAIHDPSLRAHLLRMAKELSILAAWGLEHDYRGQPLN